MKRKLARSLGPAWAWVERLGMLATEVENSLFVVGGPVRDALLGRPVEDLDLVDAGSDIASEYEDVLLVFRDLGP